MRDSLDIAVLAIDGGGSRCRLACAGAGRESRVETGPANVYSDFDGAVARIRDGLSKLAAEAGVEVAALVRVPAFVGLAGVCSDATTAKLHHALPFERMLIEDDRPAALRGALGHADGAVIHCGTGSFLAFQKDGETRLAGGWGAVLGDEASARWIGWMALNHALRVTDGTLPANVWARALVDDMGGVDAVLQFASSATPADFGTIAPRVTEAATEGDPLALSILERGADHVARAVQALGWSEGMALCLTGGVAPFYRDHLPQALADALQEPEGAPLDGALSLAREMVHDDR
ncbi:MAG: BadF/BadG/BcrA/BcrD ATPase family protein [Pseudomonadota bacterium]